MSPVRLTRTGLNLWAQKTFFDPSFIAGTVIQKRCRFKGTWAMRNPIRSSESASLIGAAPVYRVSDFGGFYWA